MKSLISKANKKEALLILFITIMGYGVALSYEVGYSIYFLYDIEFIQIDIKSIYNGILNTSVFVLLYASFFFTLKQKNTSILMKLIQIIIYTSLPMMFFFPLSIKGYYTSIGILIFFSIVITGFVLIYHFVAKKDKVSAMILICISILFILFISTLFGINSASSESNFSVFKYKDSEYAIIRIYNGNIVGIKVDNNKLSPNESIYIPSSESSALMIRGLRIDSKPGTLTYKDEYPDYPPKSLSRLIYND